VVVHEDVGVAGLHRILPALPDLERADCVVAVAGMDAALASVVGGLVAAPVIGVPTSVGYGNADGGRTALNAMLTSCAAALAVVGIDDGFGRNDRGARHPGTRVIVYLDCVGGLAGNMLIAALLDADGPEQALHAVPGRLGLEQVDLRLGRVRRHGIGALHLEVVSAHDQHERSWRSIRDQLARAELDERVRNRAIAVFTRLAEAEGMIHGVPPEDVHFDELGAVDTLVDIVGAVTLLDALGVSRLVCSPLPTGHGVIGAAHGTLPLPAPATAALLLEAPIFGVDIEAELVTPTGAALASTLADGWGSMAAMTLERIGYGAGTAELVERANLTRVLLGRDADREAASRHEVALLETNLDDLNPELVPDAIERCFGAGALDVWTVPIGLKKGRPGIVLSALARPEAEAAVARAILEETTALGVGVARLRRHELDREERTVEVYGRPVHVKLGRLDGRVVNVAPEHDDCAAVARATGTPVKSVWAEALAAARRLR
jgi:pyridinium-3,5-bisthiocarboxylic acid mononucleotide nickel chelatase